MPDNHFITKLLEIKDIIIENITNSYDENHIYFKLQRKPQSCPNCGTVTDKVHDYRTSIIKDLPFMGRKTLLHYKKRRYVCPCCNKRFYETFGLTPKYFRTTTRLALYSLNELKSRQSIKSVAEYLGLSVSAVSRIVKHLNFSKPKQLPEVLSIDEFKGNAGGEKFQAIITDAKKHKLLDIMPSRKQVFLKSYFLQYKNRKSTKYFVMDMNKSYKTIAEELFPNATIVIDKFHVVRYVNWALENVRKRVQKNLPKYKRIYFKKSRWLLLSKKDKLKEENLIALEVLLSQSKDLGTAYHLKELFYEFIQSTNRTEAVKRLKHFTMVAYTSELKEFNSCLTMLRNWSTYILNAFDCKYTNGYTEGTNNAIKVVKRNAFGFRNFDNFRNRIFLSLT